MTCLSCHDPHHKPPAADRIDRYRAACLACHDMVDCTVEAKTGEALAPDADCTSCHMPLRRPADAIHTLVTDHRIQIPPDNPESLVAPRVETPPPDTASASLHRGDASKSARLEGLGRLLSGDNSDAESFTAALPGDAPARQRLAAAEALLESGRRHLAEDALRSLLRESPWMVPGQVNLALIEADNGQMNAAIARLEGVVLRTPEAADAWSQLGPLYWRAGRVQDAIRAAGEAARLRGVDASNWHRLGTYLASAGAMEGAARSFARSEALAPGNEVNAYNLGLALWKLDRPAAARRAWSHALGRSPESGQLLKMAAITTALPFEGLESDPAAGAALANRWHEAAPDEPDALVLLAATLQASGDEAAPDVLARAVQAGADPAASDMIRALLLWDRGAKDEATAQWRRVSLAIDRPDRLNILREGLLNRGREVLGD